MHINKVSGLLVLLCCELSVTIKVPTNWDESGDSAVNNQRNDQVEFIRPQNVQTLQQSQPIPIEYFQYTAQKPQFATDIATFHGVKNPQQHYKAYPIEPFTRQQKPVLGIHHMLNGERSIYQPFQKYVKNNEELKTVQPASSGYEIFHPYKAEEPALQEIYKDPILAKIRNDIHSSKSRLQAYEQEAGKPNISDDEYLESVEKTDGKLFPQKNVPAPYEIHRPERRPIYYKVLPQDSRRDHILNQKFKHPWNQQNIKIRPVHYKPLKNHIHNLRQQHALKYTDEQNEYPQVQHTENIQEPPEGYDIYEKGKQKYTQLRNNVDESINKAVQQNRPIAYQKLELQQNQPKSNDEEDEFIPIKNYAQVRKTETVKHLPRKSAFDDAETYEEIINAPRLREAVKSTKAQIVYSEEGYEDSAYDHAGEQKHASDHEGHGGFLKEHQKSGGLYKIPTVLGSYQDGRGSEYRDNVEHEKKWKNDNKDEEEATDIEDYSENEQDESIGADIYNDKGPNVGNRNKREGDKTEDDADSVDDKTSQHEIDAPSAIDNVDNETNETAIDHDVDKREVNFNVPEISLKSTYLTEEEILKIAKQKILPGKGNIKDKYPYYYKKLKSVHKNSPLRYAEDMKLIPKKSNGGTEFYDSRSLLECPEVDDNVDPIPEKLKNDENPDDAEDEESNPKSDPIKKQSLLNGLGDKIDCFKAKYFGENPLDSPFFREEIISEPEPITVPKLLIYEQLKLPKISIAQESKINNVIDLSDRKQKSTNTNIFLLLDKLRTNQTQDPLYKSNSSYKTQSPLVTNSTGQSDVYSDILTNIKNDLQHPIGSNVATKLLQSNIDGTNLTYNFFQNKEEVTKLPQKIRRKRAAPFIYEPYKIIRDSQYQDSKKTTTTSNISPLIRQLQSSRVGDRVSRSNRDDGHTRQIKPNTDSRTYVDIGKKDRPRPINSPTIVDISVDQRRGEPRYEIRPTNHKSEYTPVENKRTMSVEDYKTRTSSEKFKDRVEENEANSTPIRGRQRFSLTTTVRPVYDVTSFLPKPIDVQNSASSNAVKKTITTTTPGTISKKFNQSRENSEDDDDDDDDDDNDSESEEDYDSDEVKEKAKSDEENTTTTTTTTPKPSFRRRKVSTTTIKPNDSANDDQPERLRLVTRFRNYKPPSENPIDTFNVTEPSTINKYREMNNEEVPKYREKKKKSTESTLVTDTKKYGEDTDDDDDMRKEEIDDLIGVKENMDDYMPSYEKEEEYKGKNQRYQSRRDKEDEDKSDDDDDDDDDEDDNDDEDNEDDDDDEYIKDEDDDDEDDDDEDENEEEENEEEKLDEQLKSKVTTPEPTKRTLVRTTDAPPPTVASNIRSTVTPPQTIKSDNNKPIVTRKKIEIHKEIPVNKSAPHVTQFKQDIKEIEIIKEMPTPKRKSHKKVEPLELYKDDNLAKDINKLGDVEIFSDGIDIDKGPKHGGNYRRASKEDLRLLKPRTQPSTPEPPKDVEASQSENTKHIELDEYVPRRMHGGNFKSENDIKRTRTTSRNAKLTELSDKPIRSMHGGNLKIGNTRRGGRRSEKLIELDDDRDNDNSSQDDDYKSTPHNSRNDRLHGGNYRSAKLVQQKQNDDIRVKNPAREARRSAAVLLNNFVQAVPALTTTPGYILDPSKRMYYYVDI